MLQNSKQYFSISKYLSNLFCNSQSVTVEKETPFQVDPGLLLITDPNPIDEESYKCIPVLLHF